MLKVKMAVVLAAMACLFAVTTSSAFANVFNAKTAPVTVKGKGTNTHVFSISGTSVECKTVSAEGKANETKTKQLIEKISYSGCEAFFFPATVTGCEYNFHAGSTKNSATKFSGTVTVLGTACEIKVPGAGCTVKVTEASNKELNKVEYIDLATSPKTVEINAEVTGITYTVTGPSFPCGSSGSNGKYNGRATAEAASTDISVTEV